MATMETTAALRFDSSEHSTNCGTGGASEISNEELFEQARLNRARLDAKVGG